jgi:RNA polymerase sigma-70 factor (ECF subfamily)
MGASSPETPSADWQEPRGAEPSDHSLLHHVRSGNQDAATKLYFRYAERVRALARIKCSPSLARRVDPEDIVQSVFHRFFQHACRGDYDVPAGEELWKLFLVIALNKIRKEEAFHRAAKRDVGSTFSCHDSENSLPVMKPGDVNEAFLQMAVSEALQRLPEAHQKVV